MTRRSGCQWALFTLLALGLLGRATPVSAHAIVISTDPPDGAVLDAPPAQVRVAFSEPIILNFTSVELTDSSSQPISVNGVRLESAVTPTLIVDLPSLPPGAYRMTWRALSADDLHNSSGSVVFGVGQAAELAPLPPAPPPAPLEVALRWLNLGALGGITGGLTAALVLLPPAEPALAAAARRRLLQFALAAAGLALVVGAGLLVVQSSQAGAPGASSVLTNTWQILTQTDYGTRWLRRELVLIGLAVASAWLLWRGDRQTPLLELAAASPLVLALMFLQALSGHAAGLENSTPFQVAIDAMHLLAVSLWIGVLMALVLTVAPLLRQGEAASSMAWATFRRFSALALISVAAITATGLYNSSQQVASADALLFTLYGQSLLLKTILMLAVGLLGLCNSAVLHPRVAAALGRALGRPPGWAPFAPEHLGRTVLVEAVGGGAILLLAALLTAAQPARGPEFEPPSPEELAVRSSYTVNAADLLISMSVKPNRPGQNFISLSVLNTRRPPPAPIQQVSVLLTPPGGQEPTTLIARKVESGKYQVAGDAINASGKWQIGVRVVRPALADVTTTFAWTVQPLARNTPRRSVVVSNQPLAPVLTTAAGVFGAAAAIALLGMWLWNRAARLGQPRFD